MTKEYKDLLSKLKSDYFKERVKVNIYNNKSDLEVIRKINDLKDIAIKKIFKEFKIKLDRKTLMVEWDNIEF